MGGERGRLTGIDVSVPEEDGDLGEDSREERLGEWRDVRLVHKGVVVRAL